MGQSRSYSTMTTNCHHLRRLASRYRIVLGSGSPRRVRLLTETGVPFRQVVRSVDERRISDEEPYTYACRLSREKALAAAEAATDEEIVLGCDTIVVLGNQILQKPDSQQEAEDTLTRLSGRRHTVCTAIAIAVSSRIMASGHELTEVTFKRVTRAQIKEYVDSGEPMDKAGAYGIQGMGAFLVDSLEGNLDNVIGFPIALLENLAREILDK
ncbi:MAG: nucleoside triphosphate pyrophosphatase [Candidatus Zixiibacteriota bacterium]